MRIKNILIIVCIVLFLAGCGRNENKESVNYLQNNDEESKKEIVWVFILAGQSNMAGRGLVEPQDTITDERILTINENNELILAREPIHFYEPTRAGLGNGLSFARTLLKEIPDSISIMLIPTAVGGSSISQWLEDDEHRNVNLYSNFREKLEIGRKHGVIKGILWHQGESDTSTPEKIQIYQSQLTRLFTMFRNDAGNMNLPIIIGELGSFSKNYEKWQALNAEIKQYIDHDADAFLVKTGDLHHKGDSVHFDSEGQRTMGRRYADKYMEILRNTRNER
ncbi:MAG: sialate O-acetylesterase [Cyclobacteriaceae bacterium]|nr:sialate O-acetylesterase [Cyclobacteriaceae bacterium]